MFDDVAMVADLQRMLQRLATCDLTGAASAGLIDVIGFAEDVKNALAGLQAHASVVFDTTERSARAARGWSEVGQGRGLGEQVALARREPGRWGRTHLGLGKTLTVEMPCTYAALRGGRISERRARIIVQETACLSLEHRTLLDAELAGTPARVDDLMGWSDRETQGRIAARAAVLDPASVVERRRRAEADRHVSMRPVADAMCRISFLLPVRDGVAAYVALKHAADTAHAAGDPRTKQHLMTDTFTDRVTGRTPVTDPVKVTLNVVVPDTVLFGTAFTTQTATQTGTQEYDAQDLADTVGAWLDGYGPVPDDLVGDWAAEAGTQWRRLYADRAGRLVAMESTQRCFPPGLKQLIRLRDHGTCRIPWCDAPIAEADHVHPWAEGGPTRYANGQGLCRAHNLARQAGWRAFVDPITGEITTTTPTGHRYTSTRPGRTTRASRTIRPAGRVNTSAPHHRVQVRAITDAAGRRTPRIRGRGPSAAPPRDERAPVAAQPGPSAPDAGGRRGRRQREQHHDDDPAAVHGPRLTHG